jgi:hypothetical protein
VPPHISIGPRDPDAFKIPAPKGGIYTNEGEPMQRLHRPAPVALSASVRTPDRCYYQGPNSVVP